MVDERIDIWNILHDGKITVISEEDSKTLILFVNIPYLRRRLNPLGDSFVLTIEGLRDIRFQDFGGTATSFREEVEMNSLEILSTDSQSMPVRIFTTMGELTLDFTSIRFALDTGEKITFEIIEKVCEAYWDEWKEKTQHKQ